MSAIRPFSVGDRIKHIKTGRVYTVVSVGLMKSGGLWDGAITYERGGDYYTRSFGDFNMFILYGF